MVTAERGIGAAPNATPSGARTRRGLIAGAAALVAGLVAKRAGEQPVAAANGSNLHLGEFNTANNSYSLQTGILYTGPDLSGGSQDMFSVRDDTFGIISLYPAAVAGYNLGKAMCGVFAYSFVPNRYGMVAVELANGTNGRGLLATSAHGTGVYATTTFGAYGVIGRSDASGGVGVAGNTTNGYGIVGSASSGTGVLGQSTSGPGVYGYSTGYHGVIGATAGAAFGGVFGLTNTAGAVGVYGSTVNPGTGMNTSGAFAGYMDGNFAVVNGFKSAAVPHPDGSHRLVYCMESPDNWFEDFGGGVLASGKAEVRLDADFAGIVHTNDYRVFVMPEGECRGLAVTTKTAAGFTVRELQGGASSVPFSYRVVARRKDIQAERLAKVNLPNVAHTTAIKPPGPPKQPDAPKIPDAPAGASSK